MYRYVVNGFPISTQLTKNALYPNPDNPKSNVITSNFSVASDAICLVHIRFHKVPDAFRVIPARQCGASYTCWLQKSKKKCYDNFLTL